MTDPRAVKKILHTLDEQFEALQDAGLQPRVAVLSLSHYQGLMAYLAGEAGLDHMEAHAEWRNCRLVAIATEGVIDVVPDVQDLWEQPESFLRARGMDTPGDAFPAPKQNREEEVRFTDDL